MPGRHKLRLFCPRPAPSHAGSARSLGPGMTPPAADPSADRPASTSSRDLVFTLGLSEDEATRI